MTKPPLENKDCNESASMSYRQLRIIVGFLGMSLPIIVVVGAWLIGGNGLQGSISAYYHTVMRDVFVGILFITGAFLITYNPEDYPDGYIDNIASFVAGISALGIALFPADQRKTVCTEGSCEVSDTCGIDTCPSIDILGFVLEVNTLHIAFSVMFFVILTIFSLFLFTKSGGNEDKEWTPRKVRYYIYVACGSIMAVALVLMLLFYLLRCCYPSLQSLNPIFWLETVALLAFGFSWLTKGQLFFSDKDNNS